MTPCTSQEVFGNYINLTKFSQRGKTTESKRVREVGSGNEE